MSLEYNSAAPNTQTCPNGNSLFPLRGYGYAQRGRHHLCINDCHAVTSGMPSYDFHAHVVHRLQKPRASGCYKVDVSFGRDNSR